VGSLLLVDVVINVNMYLNPFIQNNLMASANQSSQLKELLTINRGDMIKGTEFLHIPGPLAEGLRKGLGFRIRSPSGHAIDPMALVASFVVPSALSLDTLGCCLLLPVPRSLTDGSVTGFTTFAHASEICGEVKAGCGRESVAFMSANAGVPGHEHTLDLNGFYYPLNLNDLGTLNGLHFSGIGVAVETPIELQSRIGGFCNYQVFVHAGDTSKVQLFNLDYAEVTCSNTCVGIHISVDLNPGGTYSSLVQIQESAYGRSIHNIMVSVRVEDGRFSGAKLSSKIGFDTTVLSYDESESRGFLTMMQQTSISNALEIIPQLMVVLTSKTDSRLDVPSLISSIANSFIGQDNAVLDMEFILDDRN